MFGSYEEVFGSNKGKYIFNGYIKTYDVYGNINYRKDFRPTKKYLKYLEDKQSFEYKQETQHLIEKLKYQQNTYGEVDKIDLLDLQQRLKKEYNIKY